jgi:hypothetical protein
MSKFYEKSSLFKWREITMSAGLLMLGIHREVIRFRQDIPDTFAGGR